MDASVIGFRSYCRLWRWFGMEPADPNDSRDHWKEVERFHSNLARGHREPGDPSWERVFAQQTCCFAHEAIHPARLGYPSPPSAPRGQRRWWLRARSALLEVLSMALVAGSVDLIIASVKQTIANQPVMACF